MARFAVGIRTAMDGISIPHEPLRIVNPASGKILREVPVGDAAAVNLALERAREAQPRWGALPVAERARRLRGFVRWLRDDRTLLDTIVSETGKPRYEAEVIELFYTLELTRYYTGWTGQRALRDEFLHPLIFATKRARVVRHPRGVVGVIGPWNFPLLNNFADCVAPLCAGNAVVLKPSEQTPLTSLRVVELWREAGLPQDVFQVVPGRGDAGAALAAGADMVFFTGGADVGREVARVAAARLVPAVLELGGKSPMIVLADADLPRAAHAAVWSGFAGNGQICIRTERVLVEAAVADHFIQLCAEEISRLRQGPPLLGQPDVSDIDVGAVTFAPLIERMDRLIADAVARGAYVVAGGALRRDLGAGRFFAPTLIANATPDMAVMREETFGPVLPVMSVRDADEALRIANDTSTGLSGCVWSADANRARRLARRMKAGSVCVNDVLVNYFCVEAPFCGVKESGIGLRHSSEGLRQFCRVETIIEDHPLLGWLSPFVGRQLTFPYQKRTLHFMRWFMRWFY